MGGGEEGRGEGRGEEEGEVDVTAQTCELLAFCGRRGGEGGGGRKEGSRQGGCHCIDM